MRKDSPKTTTKFQITYIKIDLLKPAEYNPRKANKQEYKELRKSIERFGLVDPFIVNEAKSRKNIIIGGHFRWRIARELGIEKIPIVYVNIPDVERERELNLRLNKNLGQWDEDLLANFHEDMLKDVGFSDSEINKLFELGDEVEPEIPFTEELLEEHNYVVFFFEKSLDFNVVKEKLGIIPVQALDSKKGYKRVGVGRVLSGKKLIDLIQEAEGNGKKQ